jgi:hypothetical protein
VKGDPTAAEAASGARLQGESPRTERSTGCLTAAIRPGEPVVPDTI